MNGTTTRSAQVRRRAAALGAVAIVLAACTGTPASLGTTSGPATSVGPTSTVATSPAMTPSTAPASTAASPTPSASEAPSAVPSDVPDESPSLAPTPVPTPFAYGQTDKATGLKATMIQVGDWTATTTPTYNVVLTWSTPTSPDTVVRVEGITKCYAPADVTGKDCVTPTTRLVGRTVVLIAHARASALMAKWTWPAWEEIGEPIATDGPHDFYGIIVTFTTGAAVKVLVLDTSQTCPGCAY